MNINFKKLKTIFVIAEIGVNHNGKLSNAKKLIDVAKKAGADYVSVGPIWETPSKPGRKSIGFDYLKTAKEQLNIPYVAIGGINRENCDAVIAETPPLLGLIRDHEGIRELQETMATARKSVVK